MPNKKEIKKAVDILGKALIKDQAFRDSWRSTISMCFYDSEEVYKRKTGKSPKTRGERSYIANNAAELFLSFLDNSYKIPEGR